jgi:hypothetical protein
VTPLSLGPTGFAVVLWGAVAAVLAVFAYEVYALAADMGWPAVGEGTRGDDPN